MFNCLYKLTLSAKMFKKMYKMTGYELKQQSTENLVKHILHLKKEVARGLDHEYFCACGHKHVKGNTDSICYCCHRITCRECTNDYKIKCNDCCEYDETICKDCCKQCHHCDSIVCKKCVNKKYPSWNFSGCERSINGKVFYHCIFPISYDTDNILCGKDSCIGNICNFHSILTDDLIIDALHLHIPHELIKFCINYFYGIISTGNIINNTSNNNNDTDDDEYFISTEEDSDSEDNCESEDNSDSEYSRIHTILNNKEYEM